MIIICDICRQYVCPPSCPDFDGSVAGLGNALGECFVCSARVYGDDGYESRSGRFLCEECASELVSPELLEFLGLDDVKSFFDMLI